MVPPTRLSAIANGFRNLIAPQACALCEVLLPEEDDLAICFECRMEIEPEGPRCRFCAALLHGPRPVDRCRHCHGEKFRFERVVSLGRYEGALMQSVSRIKSAENTHLAATLGDLLGHRCRRILDDDPPEVVVPAPMAWRHRIIRGVNAPDLLAARIGRILRTAAPLDGLRWTRIPHRQSSLAPTYRRRNVRGALAASASYVYEDCHVLFVDDVLTTGATAHEAARALLAAGARRVTAACAARGLGE